MVLAAYIFLAAALVVAAFQLALAFGAPWGHLAMGGRFPGKMPFAVRLSALAQGVILVLLAYVAMRHGGALAGGPAMSRPWLIWVVVGFAALTTVLNAITPSKPERRLWLPVALVLLATSLAIALSPVGV